MICTDLASLSNFYFFFFFKFWLHPESEKQERGERENVNKRRPHPFDCVRAGCETVEQAGEFLVVFLYLPIEFM